MINEEQCGINCVEIIFILVTVFHASDSPAQSTHTNVDFINGAQSTQNLHIQQTKFEVQSYDDMFVFFVSFSIHSFHDPYVLCDT